MLAIDKSGYKDKIITYAITLAKSLGAEITVVHVIDKSSLGATADVLSYYRGGEPKEFEEALKKDAEKLLDLVVQAGRNERVLVHQKF